FSELRRDGFDCERWNRLHPESKDPRVPYVTRCLEKREGPAIAATDYVREYADQIRAFVPQGKRYVVLGTDGYGRSDTREHLRAFFEVDRPRRAYRTGRRRCDRAQGSRACDQAVEAGSGQAQSRDDLENYSTIARWIASNPCPRVSMPLRISIRAEIAIGTAITIAERVKFPNRPSTPRPAPRMPPAFELAAITPDPVPRRCTG